MLVKVQKLDTLKEVDILNTWSGLLWVFQYFESIENDINVVVE